jgi:hypothetical protein
MNHFDALHLKSIRTFLNKQLPVSPRGVRGDGTG